MYHDFRGMLSAKPVLPSKHPAESWFTSHPYKDFTEAWNYFCHSPIVLQTVTSSGNNILEVMTCV